MTDQNMPAQTKCRNCGSTSLRPDPSLDFAYYCAYCGYRERKIGEFTTAAKEADRKWRREHGFPEEDH